MSPLFIVVEGPDGVGKSTVSRLLAQRLSDEAGTGVHLTCEPSNTALGLLLRSSEAVLRGRALALACAADRYAHIDNEIVPKLDANNHVISDRYVQSSLVLQRIDGLSLDEIWRYNEYVLAPTFSFISKSNRLSFDSDLKRAGNARDWKRSVRLNRSHLSTMTPTSSCDAGTGNSTRLIVRGWTNRQWPGILLAMFDSMSDYCENRMLTALTVNISSAALPRAKELLVWLSKRNEDVLILTETSAGTGTEYLLAQFRQAGFHVVHNYNNGSDRGVALISRVRIVDNLHDQFSAVSIPGRIACAVLDTKPRTAALGVYVPARDRTVEKVEKKELFITTLLKVLAKLPSNLLEHMIIGGDYNVIGRNHQPLHQGFLPFEFSLLENLETLSFLDAHELCHPGRQVYSWIGRTGDGYRYDYFHVASSLRNHVGGCTYLHATRNGRLTDHAAVTLQFHIGDVTRLKTIDPSESSTPTLF